MATVFYPARIHRQPRADGVSFGVEFPDLPGCVTVGDTLDQAARRAREALGLHLTGMIEDGDALPEPTPLDQLASDPEYPEIGRILVDADLPGKSVKVTITLDEGLLAAIDKAAMARHMSRSGFLAEGVRRLLAA